MLSLWEKNQKSDHLKIGLLTKDYNLPANFRFQFFKFELETITFFTFFFKSSLPLFGSEFFIDSNNILNSFRSAAQSIPMMFTNTTSFFTFLPTYRLPKSSVDLLSDSLNEAGEQQMIMVVRALPPSDSCKIRVNFESL